MIFIEEKDLDNLAKNVAEKVLHSIQPTKQYINVRGYKNIAEMLGVSEKKVWEWKRDGKLQGCFYQDSKTLIFFAEIIQERMRSGLL